MGELQGALVHKVLGLEVVDQLQGSLDLDFFGVELLLEVDDDPAHEVEEVLCLPDAPRDGFLQGVALEQGVGEELLLTDPEGAQVETLHELLVLIIQLLTVGHLHLRHQFVQSLDVVAGKLEDLAVDVEAEGLDAGVVDVVALVEHHDALLLKLLGHQIRNLRVQHVRVVVDNDVGLEEEVPGEEVGAHVVFLPVLPQVFQRVNALGELVGVDLLPEAFVVEAEVLVDLLDVSHHHVGLLLVVEPHPGSGPLPAHGVHLLPVSLLAHLRVHTHVSPAAEAQR
mmetsp:Transcript_33647/g.32672  ORF Transcript_33647/g.32672 Transcript_33647/m.32672 type:complete len:282 (+) Transcript_33647:1152-1997(+)